MELTDVGTRYEHLRELLDLWEFGIVVLEERCAEYESDDNIKRLAQLKAGRELLVRQLDVLSNFDIGIYKLGRMVDTAVERKQLKE